MIGFRSRFASALVLGLVASLTSWSVATPVIAAVASGSSQAGADRVASSQSPKSVMQDFSCTTPIGDVIETVGIAAKASATAKRVKLRNVVYSFTNNFHVDVTITDARFSVPDPKGDSAPYRKGSASVAADPPGWEAGHKGGQIFETFAGQMDVAQDETIPVAALSAAYKNSGPAGTVVKWKAGPFSFEIVDAGSFACEPIAPFRTIASVTE